jgi:MYXO-CTERM domain-containing protein
LLKDLPQRVVLFSDAIQPLFRSKCGKCHIKDSPAGGIGVDQHQQLLEGGYSGPGVVPKDRAKSYVMARLVLPASDDEHMPPEGEPQLTPDEVELVGAWIDQGAPAGAPTEVAKLTGGAVRALSALGVKPGPEPLAAQSGGCAACSVPGGAPRSGWLEAQALALLLAAGVLVLRRSPRR